MTTARDQKYRTICADPPWTPLLGGTWTAASDKGRGQRDYSLMTIDDICGLRVSDVAAEQAHLWLWCLSQHIDWGYEVARAWGFEPCITLTWEKPGLGVGRWRCNTEHIVVARRGSRHDNPFGTGGRNAQATAGTCFHWPRGRHSEKPDAFYGLVESVSPGPYLELFARRQRLGWDSWGNECRCDVEMVAT